MVFNYDQSLNNSKLQEKLIEIEDEDFKMKDTFVLVNPEIKISNDVFLEEKHEDCFSCPFFSIEMPRYMWIYISFTCGDTGIEVKDLKLDQRDSIWIQQYIDLLEGKTILDNCIENDITQNGEPWPWNIRLRQNMWDLHGLKVYNLLNWRYWAYVLKVFVMRRY